MFNCHRENDPGGGSGPHKENATETLRKFSSVQSTSSITIASTVKATELNDTSAKQSIKSGTSTEAFSWSRMQDLYLENTKNSGSNDVLSKEIISSVLGLLNNLLDENELKTAKRLYVRYEYTDLFSCTANYLSNFAVFSN